MPISYKYKTIFIHIPKCAGTSIEKMFDMSSEDQFFSTRKIKETSIAVPREKFKNERDYQCCISKPPQHMTYTELKSVTDINETFRKITVVRNPYSRFVSEYEYRKKFDKDIITFEDLVNCLTLPILERVDRFHGHLETQVSYLKDGKRMFEGTIIKYEDFPATMDFFTSINPIKTFPHSLKAEYFKPYNEYYTPELAQKILDFYKEDFEMFNYNKEL